MSAVATVWKNDPALDTALAAVAPDLEKWAAVILVEGHGADTKFEHYQFRQSAHAQNFWPASCIKLYVMVAALECLTEHGLELDTVVSFERKIEGQWQLDCARSVREMLSEVCRRSSNEDYTLLLRWLGVDHLNTKFFVDAKGFTKSALMRGYAGVARPYGYALEQAQRITLQGIAGKKAHLEHEWSGRFHSEERGCTIIDAKRGNVTTAAELAECLRRVMFHEVLPESQRYQLTPAQLAFLRSGAGGFCGLKTINPDSGPFAWTKAIDTVFPRATFYHKCGVISNFALETAYVDDEHDSGKRLFLVPVINAGLVSKPVDGAALVGQMARAIGQWARGR